MAEETKRTVRGDTVTVYLRGDPKSRKQLAPFMPGCSAPDAAGRPAPPVQSEFYHLHTFHTYFPVTGLNEYTQIRLETSIFLNETMMAQIRAFIFPNWRLDEAGGSGREIWSTARVQAGSTDTDGLIVSMRFTGANGASKSSALIASSTEWSPRVSYLDRLTAIDEQIARDDEKIGNGDLDPFQGQQGLLAMRRRIALEGNESWTFFAQAFVGHDGTLRTSLLDGRYDVGVESARHLQAWNAADTTNYAVTFDESPGGPAAPPPIARVGPTQQTVFQIFAAPQLWQYLIQWYAIYAIGTTLFVASVAIPQTGTYVDALPLLPLAYRLSGPDQFSSNSVAISNFVGTSLTYQAMKAADRSLEIITPFFFIILQRRIGGRVTLIQIHQPAGAVCAIVRWAENGGAARTVYVFRKTRLVRPIEIVDQTPFNPPDMEVIGDDLLFVV